MKVICTLGVLVTMLTVSFLLGCAVGAGVTSGTPATPPAPTAQPTVPPHGGADAPQASSPSTR